MSAERWYGAAMSSRCSGWKWLLAFFMGVFIASGAAAAEQSGFASPEDAAEALVKTVKARDRAAMLAILGKDAASWIASGDAAADGAAMDRFIKAYDARHAIAREGDKATLILGEDEFPFAFPIVRSSERWRFDTAAGKEEMLARRVGQNELGAIKVLQAIVDAQMEYASEDRNGDGVLVYAQKFASSPGKRDGLYWPTKDGEKASPLGLLVARAAGEGYQQKKQKTGGKSPTAYHGYHYRMLAGQGKNAPSGALDYVVKGRAIGGFAVIAYPAKYANSGIMSFIVNQDGKIYQADLGPDTAARAREMRQFDPGPEWKPVQDR